VATDFALLELTEDPIDKNGVTPYYLGWDRSGNAGTGGIGIHHPIGDAKKIATYTISPLNSNCMDGTTYFNTNFWRINWVATANGHSVTEGGSSGSSLINSNRRVIGQLYGGEAECVGFDGVGYDVYGRFGLSWDGANSSQRLKDWLDPNNTGATTTDPLIGGPVNSTEDYFASSLVIYPNPTDGVITISGVSTNLSYELFSVTGNLVVSGAVGATQTLDFSSVQAGIYFIKIKDNDTGNIVTKKLIIK